MLRSAFLSRLNKRVDDFLTITQFAPEGENLFRNAAKRIETKWR